MHLELFLEYTELLTRYSARTAWWLVWRKLAPFSIPTQVPRDRRVANSERSGCFVNAEVALPHSFDDSFS